MYVDAFVDIAKAGKITGRHKNLDKGRQVYAFGAGTQKTVSYTHLPTRLSASSTTASTPALPTTGRMPSV